MKIAFFSTQAFEQNIFDQVNLQYHHKIIYLQYHLNAQTADAMPSCEVICCFVSDKIDRDVIDILLKKGVKLIALRSAGYNHVDIKYAIKNNLMVCRVPAYSPHAIAEHAVALILALNRKIHRAYNRIKEGNFSLNGLMGFDLYQKTVGVIGTGGIGTAFLTIMKGFGCKLLAYDIHQSQSCIDLGVQYVELAELLGKSDIISLHCPLNPETFHIINDQSVKQMKNNVMLINTGRGQLLQTSSLIKALKSKKIGYLGLDVYEEESLFFEDHSDEINTDDLFCRLQTFPNVLITGHQGFLTQEAVHNIAHTTLNNIQLYKTNASLSTCLITK